MTSCSFFQVPVAVGCDQLSWSLTQRLGPSPPTHHLGNPARHQTVLPLKTGGKKRKRRTRRALRAAEMQQEAARDVKLEDPRDNSVQKKSGTKRRRKRKRRPAAAETEKKPSTNQ